MRAKFICCPLPAYSSPWYLLFYLTWRACINGVCEEVFSVIVRSVDSRNQMWTMLATQPLVYLEQTFLQDANRHAGTIDDQKYHKHLNLPILPDWDKGNLWLSACHKSMWIPSHPWVCHWQTKSHPLTCAGYSKDYQLDRVDGLEKPWVHASGLLDLVYWDNLRTALEEALRVFWATPEPFILFNC